MPHRTASSRPCRPRRGLARRQLVTLALGTAVLAVSGAAAHDLGTTETQITLGETSFEIVMICDLDALALGAGPGAEDAANAAALAALSPAELATTVERLEAMFGRRVRLFADDEWLPFTVTFPDRAAGRTLAMEPPTFLGLTARLRGTVPAEADTFRFRLSRAFPSAEVVVIDAEGRTLLQETVPRGEDSSTFARHGGPDRSADDAAPYGLGRVAVVVLLALLAWLTVRRLAGARRQGP